MKTTASVRIGHVNSIRTGSTDITIRYGTVEIVGALGIFDTKKKSSNLTKKEIHRFMRNLGFKAVGSWARTASRCKSPNFWDEQQEFELKDTDRWSMRELK